MCYCLSNKNTSNFSSLSNDFSINFFLIHQQVVMVVASRSISIWVVNQINWHWRCSIAHRFTWTPSDSKSLDRAWCASSHTHTHARGYALWFLSIAARLSGLTLPQMGPTTNEKCREETKKRTNYWYISFLLKLSRLLHGNRLGESTEFISLVYCPSTCFCFLDMVSGLPCGRVLCVCVLRVSVFTLYFSLLLLYSVALNMWMCVGGCAPCAAAVRVEQARKRPYDHARTAERMEENW